MSSLLAKTRKRGSILPLMCLLLALRASADVRSSPSAQDLSPQQHFQAAQTFQLAGDLEKAATEYRQAIAISLQSLGNLRAAQGNSADAIHFLRMATSIDKDYAPAQIDLAIAQIDAGDLLAAKNGLEKVISLDQQNVHALHLLGKIETLQGDYRAAVEHLKAALVQASDFDVGYTLAIADLRLKNRVEAGVLFDDMLASIGPSARLHALIGLAYRETGYFDDAISQFNRALTLDPKFPRIHSSMGLAFLMLGPEKFLQAKEEFLAELRLNPSEYTSQFFLGILELNQHRLEEAEKWFTAATRLAPRESAPLLNLGQVYFQQGEFEKCVSSMRQGITLSDAGGVRSSSVADAHALLGSALQKLGKEAEANAEFAAAQQLRLKNPSDERQSPGGSEIGTQAEQSSQRELREVLNNKAAKSTSPPATQTEYEKSVAQLLGNAYDNLGVIDARGGRYASAVDEFAQAARWAPETEALDRNWGVAAFRAGLYAQAAPPLQRQLRRKPDDMEVREMLGVSYFMVDDFVHSAEVLQPVADQLPDNPGLLYAAGVSLVRTGNPKQGGKMFSRMLEHGSNVPEIHLLLGQAHAEQGEYADALKEISQALELNSKLAEAHYYAGKVHFKQGKLDEAAKDYQTELDLNPHYMPAMYELAYVRLQQHQTEAAAQLLKEIVSEKPDYADAYYQLGKAMLEQGDVKTAIQNLETSVRLQPSSYAYYQLSFAYRRDGRPDEAKHALEKYESLHKKQPSSKSQSNN